MINVEHKGLRFLDPNKVHRNDVSISHITKCLSTSVPLVIQNVITSSTEFKNLSLHSWIPELDTLEDVQMKIKTQQGHAIEIDPSGNTNKVPYYCIKN